MCYRRAALDTASKLYDSVDDALHRLVRVSNRRARNLDALGRLAGLVNQLEKVSWQTESIQRTFFFFFFAVRRTKVQFELHSVTRR